MTGKAPRRIFFSPEKEQLFFASSSFFLFSEEMKFLYKLLMKSYVAMKEIYCKKLAIKK